tara:strand:- start:811 stop:1032 length:222 start_codon:yes stop_codon:yes gene_type:complete
MCVGGRPKPPPLPEPQPTAPRPEKTAERVVVGNKRSTLKKKKQTQRNRAPLGTRSLQIPLLDQRQTNAGNLRY